MKLIIEQAELPEPTGVTRSFRFGAFPELRAIPDDDIVRVQIVQVELRFTPSGGDVGMWGWCDSPPRAWGIHQALRQAVHNDRFTPTGVGNTL